MDIDQIKKKIKCCASEKPLSTSKHLNMVQLNKKAKWEFPVWGNLITGQRGMACAYVHDDCIDETTGKIKGEIRFAVEFVGEQCIYHPVESLES